MNSKKESFRGGLINYVKAVFREGLKKR
ncbi:hypothetical protein KsCSTR_19210 [Candidatus Kuenenia stuttgartiensis]|uniref:Uncharacterized protein n=1 Tax=Kuenenia stuttgartiensis TaxID=174633 RepID=A0A6G7GNW7_KUEST|nr:hypothetical protein KsCSTR_19210 [Candidatus Kuenenia stuttgartiensis]